MGTIHIKVVSAENTPCGRHPLYQQKVVGVVVFRGKVRAVFRCEECHRMWHEPVPSREVVVK